jgi:hypothetical protein
MEALRGGRQSNPVSVDAGGVFQARANSQAVASGGVLVSWTPDQVRGDGGGAIPFSLLLRLCVTFIR